MIKIKKVKISFLYTKNNLTNVEKKLIYLYGI